MKKNLIKRVLPGLLVLVLAISIGCSMGTALGKYVFSEDVSFLSLTVKLGLEDSGFVINVDTTNVQNITIKQVDFGAAVAYSMAHNCTLQLIPHDGYLLPETITLMIGEGVYTVSTVPNAENPEGICWSGEDNLLEISSALIPEEGGTIAIYAEAVPDPEATEPEQTEPEQTEPEQTEPEQTEPEQTEPEQTEPEQIESEQTEPDQTEPEQTVSEETESPETAP